MDTIVFESQGKMEFMVEKVDGKWLLNGSQSSINILPINAHFYNILIDGKSFNLEVLSDNGSSSTSILRVNNHVVSGELRTALDELLNKMGMNKTIANTISDIKAPMPGLILQILVKSGMLIKKGDPVLILEAMKMENIIKSPVSGVIKEIKAKEKESVAKNQILIEF
jgi:biotin carboxyl carrier protein